MNLLAVLEKRIALDGGGIVFVHADNLEEKLSYKELYNNALLMLGALQQQGMQAGNELVIQVDDNKTFLCIFWACIMGRIIPVPLSPGVQGDKKNKLISVWQTLIHPFLICDDNELLSACLQSTRPGIIASVSSDDIAYLQFSSGSTGEPKGVMLTHKNLLSNIAGITNGLEITSTDTLLSWMPLTHDMGMIGFHLTGLVNGIVQVSIPTALFIRRPLVWMEKAASSGASVLYSTNFGFRYFLSAFYRQSGFALNLSGIRLIVNGAEPISGALCEEFALALKPFGLPDNVILPAYGLAEASVAVTTCPVHSSIKQYSLQRDRLNIGNVAQFTGDEAADGMQVVDVGYAVDLCNMRICNDHDEALPESTIGHIQVKGENVTSGYYNNPAGTEKLFTKDGWLRTGDIGFLQNERLVVTGRAKNIIIINGQNYYPHDIERVVVEAGLGETGKLAACSIKNDQSGEEQLVLFFLYKGSHESFLPHIDTVKQVVYSNMGILVQDVLPVKKMPKTTSGKIQYFELVKQYRDGDFNDYLLFNKTQDRHPKLRVNNDPDAVADHLVDICKDLLGTGNIDKYTSFWDLGINSITAMRLVARISDSLAVHISFEDIFTYNSIQKLSDHLAVITNKSELPALQAKPAVVTNELSAAQKRIWIECQLNNNSPAYNIPVALHLKGSFCILLFEKAIRALISRYEILRTSFVMQETALCARVHSYSDALFSINVINVKVASPANEAMNGLLEAEAAIPFKLDVPAQLRCTVYQDQNNGYSVLLVIHHILVDGWSMVKLLQELSEVYNHFYNNSPLPQGNSAALQYQSYVAWQKEITGSRLFADQKRYWLQELAGMPEPVGLFSGMLPTGKPMHVPVENYSYSFHEKDLQLLKEMTRQLETTPFVVLIALCNILLYRYTNSKDIVIGFDTAGRGSKEMEALIGYTLNTLCLRLAINGQQTFEEVVKAVKEKVLLSINNQLYQFEHLFDEKELVRNAPSQPFFGMLVMYQNFYPADFELDFAGCAAAFEIIPVKVGFTDLLLEFTEKNTTLDLLVRFNRSLYALDAIKRFSAHLNNLLVVAAGNRHTKISGYDFLSIEEKNFLLPAKRVAFRHKQHLVPVHLLFEKQVALSPDAVAVCCGAKKLTYKALNDKANCIASWLKTKYKIRSDDRIGFLVGRSEQIIISMLAILKSGAAFVAIDTDMPVLRCSEIVADSHMKCLLTDDSTAEKLIGRFESDFLVNIETGMFPFVVNEHPVHEVILKNLAYVIYTSGSTGKPKGIMVEHNTFAGYVQQFIEHFNLSERDIVVQQSSVAFDTVIEEIFPALCVSGSVVIAPNGGKDIEGLISLIKEHRVTILSATPLVLNEINRNIDEKVNTLRLVISGGDMLHAGNIDQFPAHITLYNSYGPSETTVCATWKKIEILKDASLLGRPIPGTQIYILDENRQLAPLGSVGEMYIEGGLARGYINDPVLTAEKFIPNPFNPGTQLFKTGDRARWNMQGELEFKGRSDFQLKVNGCRIEPEEVEKVIGLHNQVSVAAITTDNNKKYLVAYLAVKSGFSLNELIVFLHARLPFYMIPHRFLIVDKIPLTLTGKIDRMWLRMKTDEDLQLPLERNVVLPQTTVEKQLFEMWKAVLHTDEISIKDDFFDLGGDSLKLNQLMNRIYFELGIELNFADLFACRTLQQQGELIERTAQQSYNIMEV